MTTTAIVVLAVIVVAMIIVRLAPWGDSGCPDCAEAYARDWYVNGSYNSYYDSPPERCVRHKCEHCQIERQRAEDLDIPLSKQHFIGCKEHNRIKEWKPNLKSEHKTPHRR